MAEHPNQIDRIKENSKLFNGIPADESFSALDEREKDAHDAYY